MKSYLIKPFKWLKFSTIPKYYYVSNNSDYVVLYVEDEFDKPHWEWRWDDEYGSESHHCKSLKEGKQKAWEHWQERISEHLIEYKGK